MKSFLIGDTEKLGLAKNTVATSIGFGALLLSYYACFGNPLTASLQLAGEAAASFLVGDIAAPIIARGSYAARKLVNNKYGKEACEIVFRMTMNEMLLISSLQATKALLGGYRGIPVRAVMAESCVFAKYMTCGLGAGEITRSAIVLNANKFGWDMKNLDSKQMMAFVALPILAQSMVFLSMAYSESKEFGEMFAAFIIGVIAKISCTLVMQTMMQKSKERGRITPDIFPSYSKDSSANLVAEGAFLFGDSPIPVDDRIPSPTLTAQSDPTFI